MPTLPLYILAGGHSSRFGSDKARAAVHGRPLISHLADALRSAVSSITVVADRHEKFADLGFRTIVDLTPELGPLGGLQAALADAHTGGYAGYIAVVSCDWVGARAVWLELLLRAAAAGPQALVPPAVAFKGDRWEPLFALYHASIRPAVDQAILSADRALWRLLEAAAGQSVPLPADWAHMAQVNTPAALAAWLQAHPPA